MSLKKKLATIVGGTPFPEMFNAVKSGTKIVFYHGVINEPVKNTIVQANQMQFNDFKKQIDLLHRKFEIISLDEFSERFNQKRLTGKELVITFDDGYRNNLTIAAPYLNRLNIPYTIYVCPDLSENNLRVPTFYIRAIIYGEIVDRIELKSIAKIYDLSTKENKDIANHELIELIKTSHRDKVNILLEDIKSNLSAIQLEQLLEEYNSEQLLSVEEIKSLAANKLCTIASHCGDHTILHENQTEDVVDDQLILSKEKIKSWIGYCHHFAFPNGDRKSVSDYAVQKAAEVYSMGYAVNGKNVSYSDHKGYISRFSLAPNFNAFKVQTFILSNIN